MPVVGLGTWKIPRQEAASAVLEALRAGYRHLDCACDYGNECEVGEGLRAAIAEGVCRREDVWVTSKLWNTYHRAEHVRAACERTLSDLGLDYIDLYLIHFPIPLRFVPFEARYPPEWFHDPSAPEPRMEIDVEVTTQETWGAMEDLVAAGLVRNIGVANFSLQLLQDLLRGARLKPQVNQVELHPFLPQEQLVRFCQRHNVAVTGFSPLGAGSYVELGAADLATDSVLDLAEVAAIAQRHGKTPAQVVLRWALERGYSVVPKSSKPHRMRENLDILDFALTPAEVDALSALSRGRRFNDPGVFCYSAFGVDWPIFG